MRDKRLKHLYYKTKSFVALPKKETTHICNTTLRHMKKTKNTCDTYKTKNLLTLKTLQTLHYSTYKADNTCNTRKELKHLQYSQNSNICQTSKKQTKTIVIQDFKYCNTF